MKAYYQKRIETLQAKKKSILEQVKISEDLSAVKAFQAQIEDTNTEIEEITKHLSEIEKNEKNSQLNVLATYGVGKQMSANGEKPQENDMEYRKAFMEYVLKGTPISEEITQKPNAVTMTTDIGSIIPSTIMNGIIQKLRTSGQIFSRIRKTNIKGGVNYPTSSLIPTASWIAEGSVAENQKKTTGEVSFHYYKVQCRVTISLEADITSLAIFEQQVITDVSEAILVAIEKSVIDGTGTGQPKGIFKVDKATIVEVAVADIEKYTTFAGIYGKLPRAYKGGATWLLSQTDWDKYIVGMVDTSGKPIALTTMGIDGIPVERLLGLPVVLVDDDYIEPFITAAAGNFFGALVNFPMYAFNSNMQMSVKRYFDENTDMWITKATAIGDGQMLTSKGLVLLKKKD